MKKTELKEFINKFGKIIGGEKGYKKTLHGNIMHVDVSGSVYFVDNDGYGHKFSPHQVDSFEELEFKPKTP
jgi:hypothetical protein